MMKHTISRRHFLALGGVSAASMVLAGCATSKVALTSSTPLELTVMNSGGFSAAYKSLIPSYEAQTHHHLNSV